MIRFLNVYYPTRSVFLLLSEALIICLCYITAAVLVLRSDTYRILTYEHNLAKVIGLTLFTVIVAYYCDLYEPQQFSERNEIYFRILFVLGIVSFFASAVLYIHPSFGIARYILSAAVLLIAAALILWRRAFAWIVSMEKFRDRTVILGSGSNAAELERMISSRPDAGMHLVSTAGAGGATLDASDFVDWIERYPRPIHRIIVALEERRGGLPVNELLKIRFRGIEIIEASTLFERLSGKIDLSSLRPSNFLYGEGFRIQPSQLVARRLASLLVAATGLLLFLPFFPLVALLVKLSSPGPLFFQQTRIGQGRAEVCYLQVPQHGGGRGKGRSALGKQERSARYSDWHAHA